MKTLMVALLVMFLSGCVSYQEKADFCKWEFGCKSDKIAACMETKWDDCLYWMQVADIGAQEHVRCVSRVDSRHHLSSSIVLPDTVETSLSDCPESDSIYPALQLRLLLFFRLLPRPRALFRIWIFAACISFFREKLSENQTHLNLAHRLAGHQLRIHNDHRVMRRTWIKLDDEVLPGAPGERNVGIAIARQPGTAPGL